MFFKMLGGDLKSLGSYSEKSARAFQNGSLPPQKLVVKWGTARKR